MEHLKPNPTILNTVGLILMGGQAKRLGNIRKHDLVIGGQKLWHRARSNLTPYCSEIYGCSSEKNNSSGIVSLRDDGRGPAEAVAHFVQSIRHERPSAEFAVVIPVDCWSLPTSINLKLLEALQQSEADVAIGSWNNKAFPINCVIRLSSNVITYQSSKSGPKGRSMWSLFEHARLEDVSFTNIYAKNPFQNINRFPDVLSAQSALRSNMPKEN